MKKNNLYLINYIKKFLDLQKIENIEISTLIKISQELIRCKKNKKKVAIFGNGGSASISSHFSVDLMKVAKIRCVNFNEPNLITCFSNDYGYSNWVKKAIESYLDRGDVLILISSSGKSQNMINAADIAKNKGIKLITFSGFKKNNSLSKRGKYNIWVNSRVYNFVENIHQIQLLAIVDLIAKTKVK